MKLQVHNKALRLSTMKIGSSEVTSEIFKKWSVGVLNCLEEEILCNHNLLLGDGNLELSHQLAPSSHLDPSMTWLTICLRRGLVRGLILLCLLHLFCVLVFIM